MMRDLHTTAFDAGTKAKLSLYRDYLRSWLPVFLAKRRPIWTTINIFDFFAGPGKSATGDLGSPLLAIKELFAYRAYLDPRRLQIELYLNELDPGKFKHLRPTVEEYKRDLPVTCHFENKEFADVFPEWSPRMDNCANLVFLDQSGIKEITVEIFQRLVALRATDFLFFVASSSLRRFSEHPAFRKYIQLPDESFADPSHIHRRVLDYYRSLVPRQQTYYLAPFSIKKGANIYGLIFGSGHWLGIHKFLDTCWKADPDRGEANFDIDDDRIQPDAPYLFAEMNRPKKLRVFDHDLTTQILSGQLRTDRDIFLFALQSGFLPRHARAVLNRLAKEEKLSTRGLAISKTAMKREPVPVKLTVQNGGRQ